MDFTSQDIAIIEQALQIAIRMHGSDPKANAFREVLTKLQANAAAALVPEDSDMSVMQVMGRLRIINGAD